MALGKAVCRLGSRFATAGTLWPVTTMHMVPPGVVRFAQDHDAIGGLVQTDATGPSVAPALTAALGPAGSSFTGAVAAFEEAVATAGEQVADDSRQMGQALRDTVALVMATDEQAASRFTGIGVPSDWVGGGGRF